LSRTVAHEWRQFQLSHRRSSSPPDCIEPGLSPTTLWIGVEPPKSIIYITKLAIFRRIVDLFHPTSPLLLYGCGGLPSSLVCKHLRATQSFFKVPVYFLGDLDPGDLTVLLALARGDPRLRSGQQGISLRYTGIGDRLLELFRNRLSTAQFKAAILEMTPDELRHFQLIRNTFLNVEDIVGSESMRLLDHGNKIETEWLLRWALEKPKLREELRAFLLAES
jgi:hypothetical protein